MKRYRVNEIFFSLQGEGVRTGTANLFVRLAGCNLRCTRATHGFDCDTLSDEGTDMTVAEILAEMRQLGPNCSWVVLTGGEPALQVDRPLIDQLHEAGYHIAIETNGTIDLPEGIDWITVSPKTTEADLRQRRADEVKYVRAQGQAIPQTTVEATYHLISPAFEGGRLDPATLDWCIQLVKEHPPWRLTLQMHKIWGIH